MDVLVRKLPWKKKPVLVVVALSLSLKCQRTV